MFVLPEVPLLATRDESLKPGFDGLHPENLKTEAKAYRDEKIGALFGALHEGMNGIEAAEKLTIVHEFIMLAFKERVIMPTDPAASTLQSVSDFFREHQLALITIGGTGRRTMGPVSDFDLLAIAPPHKTFEPIPDLPPGSEKTVFSPFVTEVCDLFYGIRVYHSNASLYPTDLLTGDISDPKKIQNTTSLLSARLLFGQQETFDQFISTRNKAIKTNRDAILEGIIESIGERRRQHGESTSGKTPDIKDSPGYIRDLDAIKWIRDVWEIVEGPDASKQLISDPDDAILRNAESIFLQLKYTLHYRKWQDEQFSRSGQDLNLLTPDRLSTAFETFAALEPAKDDHGLSCYQLLLQHSRPVSRILRQLVDNVRDRSVSPSRRQVLTPVANAWRYVALHQDSPEEKVASGIYAVGTLLNPASENGSDYSTRDYLSTAIEIGKFVRTKASQQSFCSPAARDQLLKITDTIHMVGPAFRRLRQAGLLKELLPSFGGIENHAESDAFHSVSLDEHSLRAVGALSDFLSGSLPGEAFIAEKTRGIKNPSSLVLATLLHDVGMVNGPENAKRHSETGAGLVRKDLENLQIEQDVVDETVRLVSDHSRLTAMAYSLRSLDPDKVESLTKHLGSQEYLDKLFVLTWADKFSSNEDLFTVLKQRNLIRLYHQLSETFDQTIAVTKAKRTIAISEKTSSSPQNVIDHIESLPPAYLTHCSTRTITSHLKQKHPQQIEEDSGNSNYSLQWTTEAGDNYHGLDLACITEDSPTAFAEVIEALSDADLEIEEAFLFPHPDGRVYSQISIRPRSQFSQLKFDEDMRERSLQNIVKKIDAKREKRPSIRLNESTRSTESFEVEFELTPPPGLATKLVSYLAGRGFTIEAIKIGTGNRGIRNFLRIRSTEESLSEEQQQQLRQDIIDLDI